MRMTVTSVYESRIEGRDVRGRQPVKLINRVDEYWRDSVHAKGEIYK